MYLTTVWTCCIFASRCITILSDQGQLNIGQFDILIGCHFDTELRVRSADMERQFAAEGPFGSVVARKNKLWQNATAPPKNKLRSGHAFFTLSFLSDRVLKWCTISPHGTSGNGQLHPGITKVSTLRAEFRNLD